MRKPDNPVATDDRPELFCAELRTAEWERLLAWYRNVLGLQSMLRIDEDRYALLAAGAGRLAILGRDELPASSDRLRLVWEVAAIDPVVQRLREAGAPVSDMSQNEEGFCQVTTADPDGNQVRLIAWPDDLADLANTRESEPT